MGARVTRESILTWVIVLLDVEQNTSYVVQPFSEGSCTSCNIYAKKEYIVGREDIKRQTMKLFTVVVEIRK